MSAAKPKSKLKTKIKTRLKTKTPKTRRAKPKSAGPAITRQFRFNAAQTVQIRFEGEKKPENFRVDDMVEATLVTLDGQTKRYFQYRLVSNDRTERDGSDRCLWFFDPSPVGVADPIDPTLWQPVDEQALDGADVVTECSGHFSTRSVTSYDGSGYRHVVKLDGMPAYRMRLDMNGKCYFCDSRPVVIRKGDLLLVPEITS